MGVLGLITQVYFHFIASSSGAATSPIIRCDGVAVNQTSLDFCDSVQTILD